MNKLIYSFIIIFIFSSFMPSSASELKQIADIDLSLLDLRAKHKYASTEFYLSNRKRIGNYYSFRMADIIAPYMKDLPDQDVRKVVMVFENGQHEKFVASASEFIKDVMQIQAVVIYKKVTGKIGDTVVVREKSRNKLDMESELAYEVDIPVREKMYLQFRKLSKKDKRRIFNNGTIIFPVDGSTKRWFVGARRLKIYVIQE